MSTKGIPESIRVEAKQIIDNYNSEIYQFSKIKVIARFKNDELFLGRREENGKISPMARLTYGGAIDNWDFAIYRWSIEDYDPDEDFFPGSEHVNGTIRGAIKATELAYPL
ncbi:MAG: hypothetical protein OEX02_14270 [Cyclobacteriaceae bacterium]|nr:hypothetical protein [Cyclobacteriaceae bacterium]